MDHHSHHNIMKDQPVHHHMDHGSHVVHSSIAETSVSHDMGMHAMTFHFGFEQYVLFKQWSAESVTALSITCLFFFVLAIFYEFIKAYRRVISARQFSSSTNESLRRTNTSYVPTEQSNVNFQSTSGQIGIVEINNTQNTNTHNSGSIVVTNGSANSSLSGTSQNGHQKLVRDRNDDSIYVAEQQEYEIDMNPEVSHNVSPRTNHRSINQKNLTKDVQMFACGKEMFSCKHFFSTFLYTIQVIMAYLLMLAFMLFNVWICIAILSGAAVGHFFLTQKAAIALEDHQNEDYCH